MLLLPDLMRANARFGRDNKRDRNRTMTNIQRIGLFNPRRRRRFSRGLENVAMIDIGDY